MSFVFAKWQPSAFVYGRLSRRDCWILEDSYFNYIHLAPRDNDSVFPLEFIESLGYRVCRQRHIVMCQDNFLNPQHSNFFEMVGALLDVFFPMYINDEDYNVNTLYMNHPIYDKGSRREPHCVKASLLWVCTMVIGVRRQA
jgi:hypothetical protein